MANAFGIVTSSGNHIWVEGLQEYRPIGSMSFLGRYRVIDFPISNMSNSGIDRIQVYIGSKPRSITEHLGTGRHYNINSKRGKLQLLFAENRSENDIYNTDIAAFAANMESIAKMKEDYVVIAPSYMVFAMDFDNLLTAHVNSGADVTLLYHEVANANKEFLNCDYLELNRQKGVLSIKKNRGDEKKRKIFMDTYVLKKELFVELINQARELSSMYTLPQILNANCDKLDVRGFAHKGFFASITDFKSYYNANMSLIDFGKASELFHDDWPIYTRTNDSCPTQYFETAEVHNSVISNGCLIEGTVENSVIGRGCIIKKGVTIKNSVVLPDNYIGEGIYIENQVIDKHSKLVHCKELVGASEKPGYIRRGDTL